MSTETREALIERLEGMAVHPMAMMEREWSEVADDCHKAARLLREDGERGGAGAQEALAKIDAADEMVRALCKVRGESGAREWVMSIPARPDYDPDLVIGDALRAARKAIEGAAEPDDLTAAYLAGRYDRRRDRPEVGEEPTSGAALIAAERRRQVEKEGWTAEHDDRHRRGEMAVQAARLAVHRTDAWVEHLEDGHRHGERFPFWRGPEEYPDTVRRLVVAGALIAAEIDRLQRLAALRGEEVGNG